MWSSDFELEPGEWFGDWLYNEIAAGYFGRRLLERCPHEDSAAFVVAHEIAHHDLGHLELFAGRFTRHAARLTAGVLMVLFFRILQKRIYSPEWELAADRRAIDLCLAAGYDPGKCLYLFHIFELICLDYGDLKAVYGLDPESDEELSPEASLATKARIWLYQRERGYLPSRIAWRNFNATWRRRTGCRRFARVIPNVSLAVYSSRQLAAQP